MLYRIWSFEHDAWWRPDREGYSASKHDAGLYEAKDAAEIVEGAHGEEIAIAERGGLGADEPDVIVFSEVPVATYLQVLA